MTVWFVLLNHIIISLAVLDRLQPTAVDIGLIQREGGKKKKKQRRKNLNVDDEYQQGDGTSLVCHFQSNGINDTSVTDNFSLQTEEVG